MLSFRVTLLTFCTDPRFHTILEQVSPNRESYCRLHGYTYIERTQPYYNLNWYYAIQRLQYVLDFFDTTDLWWIFNVAGVITNRYVPITAFDNGHVTIQSDRNGLNAGSFLIHTSKRTREWLIEVIRLSLSINHPWQEQKVMQMLENEDWKDVYSVIDRPAFNQYINAEYGWPKGEWRDWRPGDFAVTFPGLPVERREELVRYTLDKAM